MIILSVCKILRGRGAACWSWEKDTTLCIICFIHGQILVDLTHPNLLLTMYRCILLWLDLEAARRRVRRFIIILAQHLNYALVSNLILALHGFCHHGLRFTRHYYSCLLHLKRQRLLRLLVQLLFLLLYVFQLKFELMPRVMGVTKVGFNLCVFLNVHELTLFA